MTAAYKAVFGENVRLDETGNPIETGIGAIAPVLIYSPKPEPRVIVADVAEVAKASTEG